MRIWFDVDGVLANFEKNVAQVANSIWPGKVPPDFRPDTWSYDGVFTKDDWNRVWDDIKTIPNFWLRAAPIQENVSALRTWLRPEQKQHEIFYITSRMPTGGVDSKSQTQLWLHKHGLYPEATVIAVNKPEEKKEIIRRYEIDLGIDDYAPTVGSLNELPEHHCYLLSQPWNQNTNQTRVNSLQEFLDLVDSAAHWSGR